MKLACGIDPGLHGAIAIVGDDGKEFLIDDMPLIRGKRPVIDIGRVRELLEHLVGDLDVTGLVAVERQSVRPQQSSQSGLKIGYGEGILVGLLAGMRIPYLRPTPQEWKGVMLMGTDRSKQAARITAQALYPRAPLGRRADEGRSDAILLARFALARMGSSATLEASAPAV